MVFEEVERLQREYTDKYVVVDADRPELARFADTVGIVKTINYNGRALVEFLDYHANIGWYDIGLDYIKIVPKPDPNAKKVEKEKPAKAAPAKATAAKPAAAKPAGKPAGSKLSTADIIAKLRQMGPVGSGGGATAPAKSAAESEGETAEALVAAPAKKAAPKKPAAPAEKLTGPLPTTTAEKIEFCRRVDAKG
jgi:hypothetical protein